MNKEDKVKALDIMRRIKLEETANLVEKNLGKDFTDEEFEKLQEKQFVKNVKYLGKIQIDGKDQDIYLLIEQIEEINEKGEKKLVEIQKYLTQNSEVLAIEDMNENYGIMPVTSEAKLDLNEQELEKTSKIVESIKSLDKEGKCNLEDLDKEQKEEIAKKLGKNPEEIEDICEINLNQEIKEETVTKNQLQGIDTKEETSLSQNIKGETLEEKLGLKEKGITDGVSLIRVSSSSLNSRIEDKHNQPDSFIVKRKNGEYVLLGEDILEYNSQIGVNPQSQENLTINNDGSVKKEKITSSYRIVNKGKAGKAEHINCGYDEMYGKEIKISIYSSQENKYIDTELPKEGKEKQSDNVRNYNKIKGAGLEEINEILNNAEKNPDENLTIENIDTDKNNNKETIPDGKEKINGTEITWNRLAEKIGERGEGSIEKTYEMLKKEQKENPEMTNEEIIDEMEEKVNDEYRNPEERRK